MLTSKVEDLKKVPAKKLLTWYTDMVRIRRFEEKVDELFAAKLVKGTTHLCIGQEACAVGAIAGIQPDDYITSTHRGHGHCIAKGATADRMMAELFGKETGYCRGKGGSLHIADMDKNNLGANGIVGGGIPIAVGAGLSVQLQNQDRVVVCFFGDGATNQGAFHEAVNLASVWKLPAIFLCENNLYGMSTPLIDACSTNNLADRAQSYCMPSITVDGNDVLAMEQAVSEAAERARQGGGPTLVVALTYRWRGHSKSDPRAYRTKEEEKEWRDRCPIKTFGQRLVKAGIADDNALEVIQAQIQQEIEDAVKFAESSPEPALNEVYTDVYVGEGE